MSQKRKRQEESNATGSPASKKQANENSSGLSAAERRQQRSERKSKKAHKPKHSTPASKAQENDEPELKLPNGTDQVADGQDFVPLTDSLDARADTAPPSEATQKKGKGTSPRSERKRAKATRADATTATTTTAREHPSAGDTTTTTTDKSTPNNARFIVFVGNLPFTTTTAQISSHFHKLSPTSIRHPTDPEQKNKSKGYAFLEFDNYSAMKTCLKVYHHSMFDPERTSKLPADAFDENGLEIEKPSGGRDSNRKGGTGRRINVELTAGGGGKSEARKEKIRVKNTRLEEQRDRRRDAERKAENAKRKKKGGLSEANAVEVQEKEDDGRGDIHPSRLKRVKV